MCTGLTARSQTEISAKGRIHENDLPTDIGHHKTIGQRFDNGMNTAFFGTQVGKSSFPLLNQFFGFPGKSDFIPGAIDHDAKLIRFKGFGNKIVGPLFHGFNGGFHRGKTGNYDDQNLFIKGMYLLKDFHTVHAGHFQIQQHDGRPGFLEFCQAFIAP